MTALARSLTLVGLLGVACGGENGANGIDGTNGVDGADGLSSAVALDPVDPSADCPAGGVRISIGPDADRDGRPDEATSTQLVCNGAAGASVSVSDEPPGDNCVAGGLRIDVGVDADGDGEVAGAEIERTAFACDSPAGRAPLLTVEPEPAGANCAGGGVRIVQGNDDDGNGTLEEGEIDTTSFVCEAPSTLLDISDEAPGLNCAAGGLRLAQGIDDDGDGVLTPGEVDRTSFVCDALPSALTAVASEPAGANCANGGVRIETGEDANRNGVLEPSEVVNTAFACNSGGGASAVAVTEYDGAQIGPVNANAQTLQQATVTVPGPGRILATMSVEAFCGGASCDGFFGPNTGAAWVWITDDGTDDNPGGTDAFSLVALSPGFSEAITRTEVFEITAAGTYTYFVRGEGGASIFNTTQGASFFRRQLTLLYVP